jgi:MFS transporter, DHA1 family, inner membrane transport protein
VATIGMAASLLALYLVGTMAFLVALVLLAWGLFATGMASSLQQVLGLFPLVTGPIFGVMGLTAVAVGWLLGASSGASAAARSWP